MKWSLVAACLAALGASACEPPIEDQKIVPPREAPVAATPDVSEQTAVGGGPAGQTPSYGQPGSAPAETSVQRDEAGPSSSDSSGSVR